MQQIQSSFNNRKPLHIIPQILELEQMEAGKDPAVLQQIIVGFKEKVSDLIAQVYQLSVERQNDKDQHKMIMSKMEQDHQRYSHEIQKYTEEILNLQQAQKEKQTKFLENNKKQKKNAQNLHIAQVAALNKNIEQLEIEYTQLKKFQQLEKQYNVKIQKLNNIFVDLQYKHHDAMNQKDNLQKQTTIQAQITNQAQTKSIVKEAPKQAKSKVITQQKQARNHKNQLKQQLLLMQRQLNRLKKQTNQMCAKNKEAKINASINIESLQQYRAVGALQIAKIKAFKQKAEQLKSQITKQTSKYEEKYNNLKSIGDSKILQLNSKIKDAKKQKFNIENELQNMRTLAGTIIEQRSDLQQFFMEAIKKIEKQSSQKATKDYEQKIYGQKVDITELDIADKQKIIKSLFTRISMGGKYDIV